MSTTLHFLLSPSLSYPHMLGGRVSIDIVGVDVEGHQGKSLEGGRTHDGHVIGGADGDGGHITSCAAADVWGASLCGGGEVVMSGGDAGSGGRISSSCGGGDDMMGLNW